MLFMTSLVCERALCLLCPLLCRWTPSCFPIPAEVNSAAVNAGERVSFQVMFFSGYVSRSGITGSVVVLFLFIFFF